MNVVTSAELKLIPLDKITPSSHQARKDFDESGIKGLAESMKQEGLLEPILVRRLQTPLPLGGEGVGEGARTRAVPAP